MRLFTEWVSDMRKEHLRRAVKLLKDSGVFSRADEKLLTGLVNGEDTVLRQYEKGKKIYPARGTGGSFGLLLTGSCLVSRGREIGSREQAGYIFGMKELFGGPEGNAITADAECKALFFTRESLEKLFALSPEAAVAFITLLCRETAELENKLNASKGGSAEKALADFLLSRKRDEKGRITEAVDLQALAGRLKVGRPALFRAFDRLVSCGAVELSGSGAVIADEDLLRQFTE